MKKINSLTLCMTFAGCFLGAGYVSGQELWQFFSSFGFVGYIGLVVAVALQVVFGIILIRLAMKTGISEMDKIIIPQKNAVLQGIFAFLQELFLFGIFVIMTAGAAALFNEVFALPEWAGSLIFCAVVALLALKGIGAMVGVFSFFVPVLVAVTAGICIFTLSKNGLPEITSAADGKNPLLSNWLLSAFAFVSYNIFGSIGILTPLGDKVKNKKTVFSGVALGGVLLFVIALGILLVTGVFSQSINAELPMLFVAQKLNPILGYVYAFLLFGGMLGTSLSSVVALMTYMEIKKENLKKKRFITVPAMCLAAFVMSLVGFSDLIGFIYPVFGYLGFAALVLIIINFLKCKSCTK
ncbi:MAG: hypothetical protein J6L89_07605 [Clostridia bacterium]|nr:hypothetical protein [Clostridia bacterium]